MEEGWERRTEIPVLAAEDIALRLLPYAGTRRVIETSVLDGGKVNLNLRVRLSGPLEEVVLRVYLRDPGAAAKEAAVLRRVAGRVPAPRTLHAGKVEGRMQGIHTYLPGVLLDGWLGAASSPALERAGREIGRALAELHSIEMDALGFLDPDLHVPSPMGRLQDVWTSFLRSALFEGRAGKRLGEETRDALWTFAGRAAERLSAIDRDAVLLHGDCKPTNVLVDPNGSLVGFLDWEFAFAGPALFDLGQMFRWPVPASFERALLESYEQAGGVLPEDWRTLARMLDLLNLVGFLDMLEQRPEVERDCTRMIEETLAAEVREDEA